MKKVLKANLLTVLILIALVLGALIGEFVLHDAGATKEKLTQDVRPWRIAGELILIRPLMLIIVPLIFTSVLTGVTSIGDPKKLGVLGGATFIFYISTMILAVVTGVSMAWLFKPGLAARGLAAEQAADTGVAVAAPEGGLGSAWIEILYMLVPDNFFDALANNGTLGIISATIVLAVALVMLRGRGDAFVNVVEALHEALLKIVGWILWLVPLGVFFLVAWAVGQMGFKSLGSALGKYVAVVIAGLLIHGLITMPLILWVFGRTNPYRFLWNIRAALLMAFGSASSLATLPVTIQSCVERGGCSRRATGLVIPLGATVNMDGTALYQGVAVIFMFQAFGIDLHFTQYLVIVITAVLAAIGAAGVPGGSLPTMLLVINAVNTSLAAMPGVTMLPVAAIGLILGVDRLLDMSRTVINVLDDAVGARIITRLAPDEPSAAKEAAYG